MRRGSPFHSRTSALCDSWEWRGWAGYLAASSYSLVPEMEYYAIRHSAGLLDVSPLYKYRISGKDALHLVNKVVTRDAAKLSKGQIYYTPWCDERGKTVDDGTLWNLGDGLFRMTAAEPNLKWLQDAGTGLNVEVEDVSEEIGALALQGPSSRAILREGADGAVEKLRYFRFVNTKFAGIPVMISRTGYTGDLGYEVWVDREKAEALWDALMEKGSGHDITPAGMLALDVARIEAGLILAEVEYEPSRKAIIEAQRYSPLELSLDWTVAFDKGPFIGRKALLEERARGPARGGPSDRLAIHREVLLGHGAPASASLGAVARESPPLLRIPPGRLGHQWLLVTAPEEVHRDRHGGGAAFLRARAEESVTMEQSL